MNTRLIVSGCALAVTCLTAVAGQTLTWVGGTSGNFSDPGAWQTAGGETATPAAGDSLVIPEKCKVTVGVGDKSLFGKTDHLLGIDIGSEAELCVSVGTSAGIDFYVPLTGSGRLSVCDTGDNGRWFRLNADNSAFLGDFLFSNSVLCIDHKKALGVTCPVAATGPASSRGVSHWFMFNGIDGAVFQNPMTITSNNNFTFASYACKVEFAGAVVFGGYTRFASGNYADNSRFIFSGPVTPPGTFDSYLQKPSQKNSLEFAFSDVRDLDGKTWNFTSTMGLEQDIRFESALKNGTLVLNNQNLHIRFGEDITTAVSANFYLTFYSGMVDVSGHTVTIGNTWHGDPAYKFVWTSGGSKVITASDEPGHFVVSGMVSGPNSSTFDGRISGHATLDYNATYSGNEENGHNASCWFFKLTNLENEVSDTDGDLVASCGWIELKSGLNMPKVGHLISKNNGRITVNTGVAINPKADVEVRGDGTLELKSGVDLTIARLFTYPDNASTVAKQIGPGKYSSVADPTKGIQALSFLIGDGVLTVTKPSGLAIIFR